MPAYVCFVRCCFFNSKRLPASVAPQLRCSPAYHALLVSLRGRKSNAVIMMENLQCQPPNITQHAKECLFFGVIVRYYDHTKLPNPLVKLSISGEPESIYGMGCLSVLWRIIPIITKGG